MTVIAVTETPSIVCPPWCAMAANQHVAELPGLEGMVVHWSADLPAGDGCTVRIASTNFPDGAPDPTEPMSLFIDDAGFHDGASLEAAQHFAEGILAALEAARS